jgi:hypothetical protein
MSIQLTLYVAISFLLNSYATFATLLADNARETCQFSWHCYWRQLLVRWPRKATAKCKSFETIPCMRHVWHPHSSWTPCTWHVQTFSWCLAVVLGHWMLAMLCALLLVTMAPCNCLLQWHTTSFECVPVESEKDQLPCNFFCVRHLITICKLLLSISNEQSTPALGCHV